MIWYVVCYRKVRNSFILRYFVIRTVRWSIARLSSRSFAPEVSEFGGDF